MPLQPTHLSPLWLIFLFFSLWTAASSPSWSIDTGKPRWVEAGLCGKAVNDEWLHVGVLGYSANSDVFHLCLLKKIFCLLVAHISIYWVLLTWSGVGRSEATEFSCAVWDVCVLLKGNKLSADKVKAACFPQQPQQQRANKLRPVKSRTWQLFC